MATEAWTLDGVTLASGNFTLLELDCPPPKERPDWISAADSEGAALMRQPLHENRVITMKLRVTAQASMNAALDQVGAVRDKLNKASQSPDGVALTWTPANSTRTVTFDVLDGEIPEMPISMGDEGYSWILQRPIFTIVLTAKPYWRGVETLTSTASSSTPFVTLEIPSVTGDVDALGRLIVTDTATQSRRHVEWGLEGPLTYNSGLVLIIDSDSLITSGFMATQTTKTGAYDPNASGNSTLTATLPAYPVAVCGTGNQSHTGVYRVKARVWSNAGSTTDFRLSWLTGDGVLASNPWVSPVSANRWEEIDLGTITIPATVVGTQRWSGQIEALDPAGTTIFVDYLILVPASDGYGKARSTPQIATGLVTGWDSFAATTAAAALNTRVAPLGGTWATSGDTTDWVFSDDVIPGTRAEPLKRVTAAAGTTGRFGILGTTTATGVQVQTAIQMANTATTLNARVDMGVIARWTDSSNYLRATFTRTIGAVTAFKDLTIDQVVAGVTTNLVSVPMPAGMASLSVWLIVKLSVSVDGQATAVLYDTTGNSVIGTAQASSTVLATGGTLASGKSGIFDRCTDTASVTRYFSDVAVFTAPAEAIILYSGRNMQIRYDDVLRQDSTATYTGRPASYRGSRFLVPPGTSRVLVKARRNNIEIAADDNVIDATQIQVGWTPRGLAVPR